MENDTVLYTFITKKVFLNGFSHEREEMSSIKIKCNWECLIDLKKPQNAAFYLQNNQHIIIASEVFNRIRYSQKSPAV